MADLNTIIENIESLDVKIVPLIDEQIAITERRLATLQKLRGLCPHGKKIVSATVGKVLEGMASRPRTKKPDGQRTKLQEGEKLNLEGDLIPVEKRLQMIASLIDAQGPMTSGAIAGLMKCSVKTIYNDTYRHGDYFSRDSNGITLLPAGKTALL